MNRAGFIAALALLGACDSVETARERADASYDEARSAAAAAGVYIPDREFVDRLHDEPPAATAPWIVTIRQDEMRGLDLATACTRATNGALALLCVEHRLGETSPIVTVETDDLLDCSSDCDVSGRIGEGVVEEFGVAGSRRQFVLQQRRGQSLPERIASADTVFIEAAFERGTGEREQMRFDTRNLSAALAWRPTVVESTQ